MTAYITALHSLYCFSVKLNCIDTNLRVKTNFKMHEHMSLKACLIGGGGKGEETVQPMPARKWRCKTDEVDEQIFVLESGFFYGEFLKE